MKRYLLPVAALAALALPSAASARVIELGSNIPRATVSCPGSQCTALTRMTGYIGRGSSARNPFVVPRAGKIVAFTVRLGNPDAQQISFFEDRFGNDPQVRLSILRQGQKRKTRRTHRLLAQSPVYNVSRYFGSAPTFVFDSPIKVAKGNVAALTVPTWAPAMAVGLGRDTWWRSSRTRNCANVDQQAAMTKLMTVRTFGCTYFSERPYYTATYIPDPRPTKK